MIQLIVATDVNGGIGHQNKLPWPSNKKDMAFFKEKTENNIVVMGRKTYDSLPKSYKPLPNRLNLVLTSETREDTENVKFLSSVRSVLQLYKSMKTDRILFVIGGWNVYKQFLDLQVVDTIWHTSITSGKYVCDTHFNMSYLQNFTDTWTNETDETTIFTKYTYNNKEELQYLTHIDNIMKHGNFRENRTGVNTYSLFCPPQLHFNLRNNRFPLLTTKKCVLRQVFVELAFYLSGQSDSKILEDQKVFVWKGNTTREFLDGRGLQHYKEGDMGPSYSFNFRHYGAAYNGCEANYDNKGFDQVAYCIDQIRNHPTSRRIIINLWNPFVMDEMSLPPCMFLYQFYVNDGELSCHANLRSSDTFLGLPWNIATAALLTKMLASVCGLKAGDLTMTTNDAHVYENQLEGAREQLSRCPTTFPLLHINNDTTDLFAIQYSDLELLNYNPQERIKVPMVV
jgi:dihydrofolate reductase/thymidylate synthase